MKIRPDAEQYKELIIHAFLSYKGYRKVITGGNLAAHVDSILERNGNYDDAFAEITQNFRAHHAEQSRVSRKPQTHDQRVKSQERYKLYKQSPEWLERKRIARKAYYEKNKK